MTATNVVVVGAGVAGLTTAYLLSQHPGYDIVVTARYMPGDHGVAEYASMWAGANWMSVASRGTRAASWDRVTWTHLQDLAQNRPEAGVHFQECQIFARSKDIGSATSDWFGELVSPDPWYKDVLPDFRVLSKSELPPGVESATSVTSVCINTAIYLPWLVSQCLKNGVVFRRAIFKHIEEAASAHPRGEAHIVVNCTGLGARDLGGVDDLSVVPARGQIVVVRNEAGKMIGTSGTDDGGDEACYIMTRAAGGGTVLGGSYQKGNWNSQVDPSLAVRIMKRAVDICPALTGGKGIEHLDIIRHGVGLRPVREGGARVERERRGNFWIVHNYGHGGAGYQSSYGCAQEATGLIKSISTSRARI